MNTLEHKMPTTNKLLCLIGRHNSKMLFKTDYWYGKKRFHFAEINFCTTCKKPLAHHTALSEATSN